MQREARMKRELKLLQTDPSPGISCWMVDDQIDHLEANILGGEDTPYCGGVFKLDIHVPERYPFQPPKVQFLTPIYHPNIDNAGRICLDILKMPPKGAWKPSWNISTVLKSVQSLMAEPNPEDPLMAEISDQFKLHRQEYEKSANEWTKKHAASNICKPGTDQKAENSLENQEIQKKDISKINLENCSIPAHSKGTIDIKNIKCSSKRISKQEDSLQPCKIVKYN